MQRFVRISDVVPADPLVARWNEFVAALHQQSINHCLSLHNANLHAQEVFGHDVLDWRDHKAVELEGVTEQIRSKMGAWLVPVHR